MLIFKDQNLRTKIWQVSWPAMVEMTMYMIIGVIDVAIVGRLGAAPLAAVGLGRKYFFTLIYVWFAFVADWAFRTSVYVVIILRKNCLNNILTEKIK